MNSKSIVNVNSVSIIAVCDIFNNPSLLSIRFGARDVGAGAAPHRNSYLTLFSPELSNSFSNSLLENVIG
jgi:hypothetical protein